MPSTPASVAIVVMAKAPVAGRSKTRLCPPCEPGEAAALAAAALEDTLMTVASAPAARRLLVLEGEPGEWLPAGFEVVPQEEGGLASRLSAAAVHLDGPFLLIGMDTPQVSIDHLVDAGALLMSDGVDAVLGTTLDGGWWAIGLREPDPQVFAGVAMSTETTGSEQLQRLHDLGLRVEALPMLRDVDHWHDAEAVAALVVGSRFHRQFTAIGATRSTG